ncbi:MAG: ketopantoate reductase family protein [Anaerolineaceae bacterium]|nr:ketopantoate reductase family protein [Anaerolineaceae bacterium]
MDKNRYLLMGCGAVGGVLAAGIIEKGYDLDIVTHNEQITKAVNEQGLIVKTSGGLRKVQAKAYTSLKEVKPGYDVVFLTMKAIGIEKIASDAAQYLKPDGFVITLQNGIVEDKVSEVIGKQRVVGGLIGWGATMSAPGNYHMTSEGECIIGELDGSISQRCKNIKIVMESAVPTSISNNIYGVLWSKLAINCVITTLGAISGQILGKMLLKHSVRELALVLVSEVMDAAHASGIILEPVGGTLDLKRLYLPQEERKTGQGRIYLSKHIILGVVGIKFWKLKSSMLQSLERGRQPEIDFMNGFVVDQANRHAIPAPLNTRLVEIVREIVAGKREIQPVNINELYFFSKGIEHEKV